MQVGSKIRAAQRRPVRSGDGGRIGARETGCSVAGGTAGASYSIRVCQWRSKADVVQAVRVIRHCPRRDRGDGCRRPVSGASRCSPGRSCPTHTKSTRRRPCTQCARSDPSSTRRCGAAATSRLEDELTRPTPTTHHWGARCERADRGVSIAAACGPAFSADAADEEVREREGCEEQEHAKDREEGDLQGKKRQISSRQT